MDQSKKTMRHFYCRDVLWETFEQMANDFDCSIDYLVNEAMRYYARSKNYQSPGAGPQVTGPSPAVNGPGPGPQPYKNPPPTNMRPAPGTAPPPNTTGPTSAGPRRPAPPTPGFASAGATAAPTSARPMSISAPPPPTNSMPINGPSMQHHQSNPMPMGQPMAQPGMAGPTLFLIYNGQRYPVTKDQFIIGRGSKTSDLAIKDGNISRKHAAVIRRNGTFYIKDLGSTNGIDYKGMRIDNKRIDEGDIFHLCDYELRFTYRTD